MSSTSMNEIINILRTLKKIHCKVLFGESERFKEWLKEKGIEDKVYFFIFAFLEL